MIGPISIGTPTMPMTRPMRCGPAACERIVMPAGMIMPPPRPCRTRKAISELGRPRQARQRRADQEQADRDHVQALGAEAVGRPAGERDHGGQREHVARRDPLDRGQVVLKSLDSVLIATLTIVVSRIDMNVPSTTTAEMLISARSKTFARAGCGGEEEVMRGPQRAGRAVGAGGVGEERGQRGAEGARAAAGSRRSTTRVEALEARRGDAGDGGRADRGQRQALDAPVAVVLAPGDEARRGPCASTARPVAAGERPTNCASSDGVSSCSAAVEDVQDLELRHREVQLARRSGRPRSARSASRSARNARDLVGELLGGDARRLLHRRK